MEKVIVRKNGTNYELVMNGEVTQLTKTKREGDGTYSLVLPAIEGMQKYVRVKYVTEEGYELKTARQVSAPSVEGQTQSKWRDNLTEEESNRLEELYAEIAAIKQGVIDRMNSPKFKLQAKIARDQAKIAAMLAELADMQ